MKHIKLFEDFLNEAKAVPTDKLVKEIGTDVDANDLAEFIYQNYSRVTGLKKSLRDQEMDFPEEIYDLIKFYKIDDDDFTDAYAMAAE